jgi:hypothetical protein
MTKQEEFLWCVQTMIMLDSHNICLGLDPKDRHKISVTGRIETIVFSIRASRHIPDTYSAEHAAHEFFYWLKSISESNDKRLPKPTWFPESELRFDFTRKPK